MAHRRSSVVRIGVDLAKSVIQVHAVDGAGTVLVAKQMQRGAFLSWCKRLNSGCLVAMEACASAHFWARTLGELGLTVRLLPASFVMPYRMSGKTGKSDANDAAAICEAASRPQMRFVPVKTPTQQAWLALHTLREGYIADRTSCMNRVRAALAEFGIVFPVSTKKFLHEVLQALVDRENGLPPLARKALLRSIAHFRETERQIAWCNKAIEKHAASDPNAILAQSMLGVGVLGASALAASVGDLSQFKNGRQFGAWLGLVPRMSSSGGKLRLGGITKRGNGYLRKLMILGARNSLRFAHKRDDEVSKWATQLRERAGFAKAAVALANKNARILWSLMSEKRSADPRS